MRPTVRSLSAVGLAVSLWLSGQVARSQSLPLATKPINFTAAYLAAKSIPDAPPPGANDWKCKPSAKHPRPVVLVHGTWGNAVGNWPVLSAALAADGYCVFALNYGAKPGEVSKGRGPIPDSAKELMLFVDKVLQSTGAAKVDLVGHSQGGGLLPRWYLKFEGGAAKVNHLVGIAPSNHGATLSGLTILLKQFQLIDPTADLTGQAFKDQTVGSDVNKKLDADGDTVPGVLYTTLVSRLDEVVTPYQQQFLKAGPGATVRNITLQDGCPLIVSEHAAAPYHPVVVQLVRNALDPQNAKKPLCL